MVRSDVGGTNTLKSIIVPFCQIYPCCPPSPLQLKETPTAWPRPLMTRPSAQEKLLTVPKSIIDPRRQMKVRSNSFLIVEAPRTSPLSLIHPAAPNELPSVPRSRNCPSLEING